ncbi:16S rRNA (cytidine(1402)-2'-O)-methyltransferase [Alicyclobacillus contaminans]|uniref:16S rRNA (cytidine(1402)-2'-O)-methyltransferase n=1 Tax=Alicyclobacillus contaminans TaxID=392016 RepID=UPI00146FA54B|nr:16S rRNA (cytidine(1402)-2'-O)-methyltransferase [Alicyclobacillus contaminans]
MTVRVMENVRDEGPVLYICSTPIGNLGDVSERLLEVLRSVDVVAAEDTRHTRKLLTHFDIHPPLVISCHEHNQRSRRDTFAKWWSEGKRIALVSDAGTPLISDPGDSIVELAVATGVPVVPVPGPSAVLSALVASGFAAATFTFLGFLPRHRKEAVAVLSAHAELPGALILYEAPHRLRDTLALLAEQFPHRPVAVAKELTKRHETLYYADHCGELVEYFAAQAPRGEYVIVLGPLNGLQRRRSAEEGEAELIQSAEAEVRRRMAAGASHARAVKDVAAELGVHRKTLYQVTLASADDRE